MPRSAPMPSQLSAGGLVLPASLGVYTPSRSLPICDRSGSRSTYNKFSPAGMRADEASGALVAASRRKLPGQCQIIGLLENWRRFGKVEALVGVSAVIVGFS